MCTDLRLDWPSSAEYHTPDENGEVSGFEFWVLGFGFRVSGFGSRASGFGFRVSGYGFRVSGLGFRVSGSGWETPRIQRSICKNICWNQLRKPITLKSAPQFELRVSGFGRSTPEAQRFEVWQLFERIRDEGRAERACRVRSRCRLYVCTVGGHVPLRIGIFREKTF